MAIPLILTKLYNSMHGKASGLRIWNKLIERWKWVIEESACDESMLLAMGEIMGYTSELLRTSHLPAKGN